MRAIDRRAGSIIWILAAAAALVLASSPSIADQMVLFKNGKVMRVKSAESKDGWTTLKLGSDGAMGVRDDQILGIQEAADGKRVEDDPLPNQTSVGGRGGAGAGGAYDREAPPPPPPSVDEPVDDGGSNAEPPPDRSRQIVPGVRPVNSQPRNRGFSRGSRFGAGAINNNVGTQNGLRGGRLNQILQDKAVDNGHGEDVEDGGDDE